MTDNRTTEQWKKLIEELECCPKCGSKTGVYVSTVLSERVFYLFGSADVYDVYHGMTRGGIVFRCNECDKPIFDINGRKR